ncbi:hypothetical protein DFQ26_002133 [Actinomortierella ambigua]|nr:hypothetical protein DFQ26_002133 [Actinomortierella ambigua]
MDFVKSLSWNTTAIPDTVKGAVAGVAAVQVVVVGVGLLGFGPGGIVAGSAAASFMSTYGGAVTVGSLCATAQSIGAAGASTVAYGVAGGIGGLASAVVPKVGSLWNSTRAAFGG